VIVILLYFYRDNIFFNHGTICDCLLVVVSYISGSKGIIATHGMFENPVE
jgi:hypothetical protein